MEGRREAKQNTKQSARHLEEANAFLMVAGEFAKRGAREFARCQRGS